MSRACDWVMPALSTLLLTFSFQFSLPFFNISLTRPHQNGSGPHQHCSVLLDNTGQRTLPKIWVGKSLSGAQHTSQKKNFEFLLTLKVETRHPVGEPIGREFLAFVIIAKLWWPEVARCGYFVSNFCVFFDKRPLLNCRYCADRARKSARACPHIWLTLFQISSKSVHIRRSYCQTREDRFACRVFTIIGLGSLSLYRNAMQIINSQRVAVVFVHKTAKSPTILMSVRLWNLQFSNALEKSTTF